MTRIVKSALTLTCWLLGVSFARPASAFVWHTETVHDAGAPDIGEISSIALDSSGRPHIAYLDLFNQDLRYARQDASGVWRLEVVESVGNAGFGLSLALDAADNAHITYFFRSSSSSPVGDLKYAKRTCSFFFCRWTKETIASGIFSSSLANGTSLAIDASGNPNVAYFDNTHGQLQWAEKLPDFGWNIANVTAAASGIPSLAIDSFGFPQIAFSDASSNIRIAKIFCAFILCGWNFETIDSGRMGTLKLTSADQPHVAYVKSSVVRYARRVCPTTGACTWPTESVGNSLNGPSPSLVLTSSGAPRIAFLAPRGGSLSTLNFAIRSPFFGWSTEVVDFDASAFGVSAVLDPTGLPHISYQSDGGGDLKHANGTPNVLPPIATSGLLLTE